MIVRWVFAALLMLMVPAASVSENSGSTQHPEASPFKASADAKADVDAALARAKQSGKRTLIIMGANWCHDSRALAGWFASPRFSNMLNSRYEVVYVDVGFKDRNLDIARRFKAKKIKGTPTVLIISAQGKLMNKADAGSWRNAASISGDDTYRYFAEL
jgi:thiol-disulfide isomerase/thioredoxin